MKKLKKRYNDWPIKTKLISIILVGLCMLSCACLTGLGVANRSNQRFLYKTLASSLSYSAKELRDSLKGIEAISFNTATDMVVQEQLALLKDEPGNMIVKSNAFRQLNTSLLNYYAQQSSINFISLTSETLHVETDSARAGRIPEDYRRKMNMAAAAADGRVVWMYDPAIEGSLSAVRSVKRISPYWLDDLGVVTINIRADKLVEESTEFSDRFGETYYTLLDGDNVLFATDNFSDEIRWQVEQMKEEDYCIIKADGHRYFAVAGTIPDYGWRYVNLVLYDDTYQAMVNSLLLYLLTLAAGAGITIILCHMLVDRLTVHITSLIEKMQKFSRNNDTVPVVAYDYTNRKDELGMLHRQFDDMASEIISLIQNDYINQILVKDAQLKALEAQIDPHFLYNVLQNISWDAKASGNKKIMEMVDMLGKMLRITLSRGDEVFTIGKEIEFVKSYMVIQQYRFEGQLTFLLDIPDEILAVGIPKLTIQPLVENAIRYAMEESDEVCLIELIGEISDGEIKISVSNSGSEFPEDLLEKLELRQIEPNGFGIGLLNIQKRLQLFGGNGYYLKLFNRDGMAVAQVHISCEACGWEGLHCAENDDC